MKNKLLLFIVVITIAFTESNAQNSTFLNKNDFNRVKIIKPEKKLNYISDVKSKYKIFQNPKYEYKLTKEIESEGIHYECYDVYINDLIIYNTKITIVKNENGIEQIVHQIPENPEFQEADKIIPFDKSTASGYNVDEATLVYYYLEIDNKYNLVWKVKASLNNDNYLLFIHASSGDIIKKSLVTRKSTETGNVNTLYNGTQSFLFTKEDNILLPNRYRLKYDYLTAGGWGLNHDNGEYVYFRPWADNDNNWTGVDITYATAFWTLQKAQYFFKNILSYNYPNYGTVDVNIDTSVFIAEYNPATKEILYSFPETGVYNSPTSIDILAHEYGHHIIGTISNGLDDSYYMEPGAINEGYADIFGKSVQNYIEGYNVNRIETLGEDVIISDLTLKRSSNNPNSMGAHYVGSSSTPVLGQPDTYLGTFWYNGFHDQGGVHGNSGVINFWFYLLTKGGIGINDFNDSYSVTGIGIEDGAKIVYNSLPLLLFESDFTDARNATILAAENLYGLGSNESQQVLNAWEAVGVDGNCLSSEIVAPDIICSQGTSVYIDNPPSGATIIWNKSSNISRVSAQGSNPCTFAVTSSGEGWLEAIINSGCGNDTLRREYSWVGNPGTPITTPSGYPTLELGLGAYQPISLYNTPGFTGGNINWWSTGSISPDGSITGSTCTFEAVSLGTGNFYVTVQNTCGTSPTGGGTVNVVSGGGGQMLVFLPNPTTNETLLSIETTSEKTFDDTVEWELEIYSPVQVLTEKKTKLKGSSTKIQTQGWEEGVYVVRVKYKDEILTGKLVVKK